MIKRILLVALLMLAAARAGAADYTDIWYLPAESGWGVNVVQSNNFLFMTFFLYGADGKPTWYVAQVTQDASGNFNGTLYSFTGTYFALPWAGNILSVAGTASFRPTSPYTATLVYTVNGVGTVTKSIQRQTLTAITIGGTYAGAQAGSYSGCNNPAQNQLYTDHFNLQVTQFVDGSARFAFAYTGSGMTCTLAGTLVQYGQLYTVPTATYQCSTGLNTAASMAEIKATSLGIEGRFSAPSVGGGCREDANFSAVLQ